MSEDRILIVKLASLGDCICCTPILREVRAKNPDAHITMLTSEPYVEIFQHNIHVNEVKTTPPVTKFWEPGYTILAYDAYVYTEVSENDYDLVINLNTLNFWGEYRRSGVTLSQHYAEMANVYPLESEKYEIFYDDDEVEDSLYSNKSTLNVDGEAYAYSIEKDKILIHRGGGWGLKTLPDHNWIPIVQTLLNETEMDIIFVGGPGETMSEHLRVDVLGLDSSRVYGADEVLSLYERHYLMRSAKLYIGADSGPMHLASSANCPTISFYTATSQYVAPPTSDKYITIQSPGSCTAPCGMVKCHTHQLCSRLILPEDITSAAMKLLSVPGAYREHRVGQEETEHFFHNWEHLSTIYDRPDLREWIGERPFLQKDWKLSE